MYQSLLFGNAVLLDSEGRFIFSKLQRMRENAECLNVCVVCCCHPVMEVLYNRFGAIGLRNDLDG